MPLLSVISSAYGPTAVHLDETIASVLALTIPDGWEMEWIVQEDGEHPTLSDRLTAIDIVKYQANDARLGISSTRNLALSRASGSLVQALDHDDILLPNAAETLIPRFMEHPIGWAIGQADDLLPDGTRQEYTSAIPFGLTPAGAMNRWAAEHDGNWPIHCAALMMRTEALRALGGWTGIPYDDEVATFAALSEITDGYHDPALTWLYRHHPLQTHRSAASAARSADGRRIALQRAYAVRATGLRFGGALDDLGGLEKMELGPPVKQRG